MTSRHFVEIWNLDYEISFLIIGLWVSEFKFYHLIFYFQFATIIHKLPFLVHFHQPESPIRNQCYKQLTSCNFFHIFSLTVPDLGLEPTNLGSWVTLCYPCATLTGHLQLQLFPIFSLPARAVGLEPIILGSWVTFYYPH